SLADAGRDPHVDRAMLAVQRDRQPPLRSGERVLERQLDLLFDVAAGARAAARPAGAASAAQILVDVHAAAAAEEGLGEIRYRVAAAGPAEHLAPFFFGHRAVAARAAAAAAEVHVPAAAGARERVAALRAGLLVHPPVGAELVVLLPLLRIAEDLVRL